MESVPLVKRYYSISEVAQMFDMNISKLRFWEEQFPSLNPKRDRSGDRKYTQEDINHLTEIVDLVENQGYTIEGAKRALEAKKKKKHETQMVINKLEEIKKFMKALRTALDEPDEETENKSASE
ncbi:MerR family transcriptional regulator [Arcicella rigui]|uniref:MerR family transcriptional regulator n=1 Tax=Arcicella rigui TaxID=797020 RepID=A0ABU5Q9E2_9BACT|nr:MerR family transcriptional regulator [Arcicella rigui]MEA5139470.1 MerR family transcriptional regulator [Arcicella rigui]